MPTFRPPLYHTSEAVDDSSAPSPYIQLTFSVDLHDDETVDGVYQLWTDLPTLNEDGSREYAPGEWHEISYAPFSSDVDSPADAPSSSSITIKSLPTPSSSTLYAAVHIPSDSASYSYTLRQVKSSGEIVWLGSDGSNGTIHVQSGETSIEIAVEAGTWDGTLRGMEEIRWSGIAVTSSSVDSTPAIVQLPTAEPIKASLVVALGIKPIDNIPFFRSTADTAPTKDITRTITMAVAGSANRAVDIPGGKVLPSKARQGTFGRSDSASLPSAVQKALAEQSTPTFDIVSSSDSHVVLAPVQPEKNANANLVILSYSPGKAQSIRLATPTALDSASPILCQVAAARRLLRGSSASIEVNLEAGLVAESVRFTEMSELRAAGGSDSFWICAPSAQSVQVGEEEVGEIRHAGHGTVADTVGIVGESIEESVAGPSDVAATSTAPAPMSEAGTRDANESEYEAEDENDHVLPAKPETIHNFWLLRMIDSLLVRIWSWIFGAGHSLPSTGDRRIAAGEGGHAGGARSLGSAPDERTPLLTTPGLSRSTSSTANSPLASPESALTFKASQTLDSYAKRPTTSDGQTTPTPIADSQTHSLGTVTVRSYAQFTFASPPPFTFYLPADQESWSDKLKFSTKTQTIADWAEIEPVVKGSEGAVVEVEVGSGKGEQVQEGSTWQVQIERL